MTVGPYTRTTRWDGKTLNLRTIEMLLVVQQKLAFPLTISQGSYNLGVTQSAGTHDRGGAVDISAASWDTTEERDRIVWHLRRIGFAAWYRPRLYRDGKLVWNAHIHGIAIGDREMSPEAAAQVIDYKNGKNGLAGHGDDTGPDVEWTEYPQELHMSVWGPRWWDADDFKKEAYEIFTQDGVIDPPDSITTPDNPRWAVSSAIRHLLKQGVATDQSLSVLETKQADLQTQVDTVNLKLDQILAKLGVEPPPGV